MKANLKIYAYIITSLFIGSLLSMVIISVVFYSTAKEQQEIINNLLKENLQLTVKAEANFNNTGYDESVVSEGDTNKGKIAYLTFDDGPSKSTEQILDILKDKGVQATFFVVGNDKTYAHNAYKRIVAEGHAIGNHSYSHDYFKIYASEEAFLEDFNKLQQLLEEVARVAPQIYRFPASNNGTSLAQLNDSSLIKKIQSTLEQEGLVAIDWNVDSMDVRSNDITEQQVIDAVLSQAANYHNVIVLMHDSHVKTASIRALPKVIEGLTEMGFQLKPLTGEAYQYNFANSN